MTAGAILFWIMAAGAAFGAVAIVLTQNVVRMAFWLVVALGSTAGLFFLLHADFVGATQLLVYVGGTVVLLIFGVMLTASGPYNVLKAYPGNLILVAAVGATVLFIMYLGMAGVDWDGSVLRQVAISGDRFESIGNDQAAKRDEQYARAHETADELVETARQIAEGAEGGDEATAGLKETAESIQTLDSQLHEDGSQADPQQKIEVLGSLAGEFEAFEIQVREAGLDSGGFSQHRDTFEAEMEELAETQRMMDLLNSYEIKDVGGVEIARLAADAEFDSDVANQMLLLFKEQGLAFAPATETGGTIRPLGFGLLGARPDKNLNSPEGLEKLSEGFYVERSASPHEVDSLSTGYLLPFEIVSVHLLVVLIGAAYLARAKRRVDAET